MDEMIYIAMTGAKQTEYAQTINANNLANVSTTGFRADLHAFSSVPVEGVGYAGRVNAVVDNYSTDFEAGPINSTGDKMDVAISGPGYFAVQAADGSEAYTRRGDLKETPGGLIQTGDGHLLLGDGGPVALPPKDGMHIGRDGTISIQPVGQSPATLSVVDRIKMVQINPADLEKGPDGLLRRKDGELAEADASIRLESGVLEHSNVNIAKTLVNMIELARQYEMQVNVIKTSEDNADAAAQLMRMN